MPRLTNPRTWMWVSLTVQCVGLAYDAVWHGLLNPSFEAVTVEQMIKHLSGVHLPLYIGVVGMLLSSTWALADQIRRFQIGVAIPIAFTGSVIQTAGEIWHAYTHLHLATNSGPIAFTVSLFGMLIVICALVVGGRVGRRRAAGLPVSGTTVTTPNEPRRRGARIEHMNTTAGSK